LRKLKLKVSDSHWIPLYEYEGKKKKDTGEKLLIDYPTLEQQDELDDIYNEAMSPAIAKALELTEGKKLSKEEENKINLSCIAFMDTKAFRLYRRLVLKFCLKDWTLKDDKGKKIKVKLNGNELDDGFWKSLCGDKYYADLIYTAIDPEIKFTESDKKK